MELAYQPPAAAGLLNFFANLLVDLRAIRVYFALMGIDCSFVKEYSVIRGEPPHCADM